MPKKPKIDLIVVIPVGPTCKIDYLIDTLQSVYHYVHCTFKVVISDDSHSPAVRNHLQTNFPDVLILETSKRYGKGLGLYVALSEAYRYALQQFEFKALLRLDTDALIIGHHPEAKALQLFTSNPTVGLAGRYVTRHTYLDNFGNIWDNVGGRARIIALAKIFTFYFLRKPIANWKIRKLIFKALHNGYELGDLIFGGAYIFSYAGLSALDQHGLLPLKGVVKAEQEEDHFFSMLICAVGFELADLGTGSLPFGCTWVGLPASPEELLRAGKKIIHSTRSWQNTNESEIRHFFRQQRIKSPIAIQMATEVHG